MNRLERWNNAIVFRRKVGSLQEYFYEKRRLRLLTGASLPDIAVVPLIMLDMNKDCQKQLLAKSPKTVEDLLHALNNVIVHSIAHAD